MSLNLELDPLTLRKVFAQHPSGVAALCAELDGEKTGIVASSFTVGVSLEPALVMFAVQEILEHLAQAARRWSHWCLGAQ